MGEILMGNQARQTQELELWQVVSSTGGVRTRQTRTRRAGTHTRAGMQRRGNVSGYGRARTGNGNAAGTVRARSARTKNTAKADTVNLRRAGIVRTEYARKRVSAVRTEYAGSRASAVRAEYARQAGVVRTSVPRSARTAGAGAQALRKETKRKAGKRSRTSQIFAFAWILLMCASIFFMGKIFAQSTQKSPQLKVEKPPDSDISEEIAVVDDTRREPDIRKDFLTISEYNRPGTKLSCVKNIFVHYTANPKTSAEQNRSYFENLGQTHERAASAHFIIGYEGEIIQCIPLEEEAYAVVERNGDSVSIECCYLSADGSFTQETYDSLVEMLAWLLDKYDLEPKDILRHYDCGGKLCPLYYVEHEDAWQKLLDDVAHYII